MRLWKYLILRSIWLCDLLVCGEMLRAMSLWCGVRFLALRGGLRGSWTHQQMFWDGGTGGACSLALLFLFVCVLAGLCLLVLFGGSFVVWLQLLAMRSCVL